jgi:hypothetical protein
MLSFDEAKHEYSYAGKKVPGVTSILAPLVDYSMIPREVMERAQLLGQAVHKATELHDQDELDMDSLDPQLVPYLDAWIKFREEVDFHPVGVEGQIFHPTYRYAGTYDRLGEVRGEMAILDIKKMMTLGPVIGLQLAAYLAAHNHKHPGRPAVARYALGLRADGTYQLQRYDDPTDWPTFLSLLTLRTFKEKHGLK